MSIGEGLRRRKVDGPKPTPNDENNTAMKSKDSKQQDLIAWYDSGTYWLTRIVLLRSTSFIYAVAFLIALNQNPGLLGPDGLLPGNLYLDNIKPNLGTDSPFERFLKVPTLLWFVDYGSDFVWWLNALAYSGLGLSLFVLFTGCANWPIMLSLWLLYHSIVNVGQRWYSFGWESQLLETGFLAVLLCPVWRVTPVPRDAPCSRLVLLACRWLVFRIMLGAGLIKIRGDECWRDLTCMNYHYETQPVPNPLSLYLHAAPNWWHAAETLCNHFVELVAPWLIVLPWRRARVAGGLIQIAFQVLIIVSGNLSFLNHLTIIPALACLDDKFWAPCFSQATRMKQKMAELHWNTKSVKPLGCYVRAVFNVVLCCLLAWLSVPVVLNLVSSRQAMNTSFDSFRIVNTYGAFGSITKERTEVILQGTDSRDPYSPAAQWKEYEFKCKPGTTNRSPCLISPYHYRLDWLMWFAAFQKYQYNPWLLHLAIKLLANDPLASDLIAHNPFLGSRPPKFIRAERYRYVYTEPGSAEYRAGEWWSRHRVDQYMPPVSLDSVRGVLKQFGWKMPVVKT